MKQFLTILVMLFAASLALSQGRIKDGKPAGNEEKAVLQTEREIFEAVAKGDVKTLELLVADDVTSVSPPDGFVQTKQEMLKAVAPNQGLTFNTDRMQARLYGVAAIVTGILEIKFNQNGKDQSRFFQLTDTLVRRQNQWQLAASHGTPVPLWQVRKMEDSELTALTALGCEQESSLKSLNSDVSAYIRFFNSTNQPITVYWLNYEGQRDPAADQKLIINPGQTEFRHTFLTHPFLIADAAGKCLGIYQPGREAGLVTVK